MKRGVLFAGRRAWHDVRLGAFTVAERFKGTDVARLRIANSTPLAPTLLITGATPGSTPPFGTCWIRRYASVLSKLSKDVSIAQAVITMFPCSPTPDRSEATPVPAQDSLTVAVRVKPGAARICRKANTTS